MKNLVILYIGCEEWNISQSLTYLTENNKRKKIIDIGGHQVFFKKMYDYNKILMYAKNIHQSKYNVHVLIYRPYVEDYHYRFVLKNLVKSSRIIFYVQKKSPNASYIIDDKSISPLKEFGRLHINDKMTSSNEHAMTLKNLLESELNSVSQSDSSIFSCDGYASVNMELIANVTSN